MARPIYLIDPDSARIAALDVCGCGDHFEGTISLQGTPPKIRQLFEQYAEIVEGQMFSLLDAVEAKIEAMCLRAVFDNGAEAEVEDLQVFPVRNAVSFTT